MKKYWGAITALCLVGIPAAAADNTPGKNLFQLEIIAYSGTNCPQGSLTGGGHRIAVKANVNDLATTNGANVNTLVRQNDIMLTSGDPGVFAVTDGNACVDGVAGFQLPTQVVTNLQPTNDPGTADDPNFQDYHVYARLVGKPGPGVVATTCATDKAGTPNDTSDDFIRCSTESWVSVRKSGKGNKPTYENVSRQLLTMCVDWDLDTTCDERIALFDPRLFDYFWNWDATGKAHAQLVFVAVPD